MVMDFTIALFEKPTLPKTCHVKPNVAKYFKNVAKDFLM